VPERVYLDCSTSAKNLRWMTGCQQLDRFEWKARKMLAVRLDCMEQILGKVNLAAFEHYQAFAPRCFENFYLNVREATARR
jgi:hypothetical protein